MHTFTFAADKDALMAGHLADGVRRVTVLGTDIVDAMLTAELMIAAHGLEVTDTLAVDWDDVDVDEHRGCNGVGQAATLQP